MPRTAASELDTTVILGAIRGGSRSAFDRLYLHYEGKVRYSVARAALKMGCRREIDELVQEVWCRLLDDDRRLLRYYEPERARFGSYIGAIAYQQALTAIVRHRRQVPEGSTDAGSDWFADDGSARFAAHLVQSDLFTKLLDKARVELAEDDHWLLREVHLNQRSCREVALELGLRENTIHKRNERLKRKLARMVDTLLRVERPAESNSSITVALGLAMMAFVMEQAPIDAADRGMAACGRVRTPR